MASHNEGSSPAAWTAVSIIFLGFVIGGVAIPLKSLPMVIVGGVVVVAGAVVGKVMQVMGFGENAGRVTEIAHTVTPAPTPEPESSSVSAG
jgi:hypothetical protein